MLAASRPPPRYADFGFAHWPPQLPAIPLRIRSLDRMRVRGDVVGVGVNDCDAFVATVRIAEIVEVLGINGSVVL